MHEVSSNEPNMAPDKGRTSYVVLNHNETDRRHERVHEKPMLAGTGLYQMPRSFGQESPTALKGDVDANQDGRTASTPHLEYR